MKDKILTGIIIALSAAVIMLAAVAAVPGESRFLSQTDSDSVFSTVTVVSSEDSSNFTLSRNSPVIAAENESGLVVLKYSEGQHFAFADVMNADFKAAPETFSYIEYGETTGKSADFNGSETYALNRAWHDVWYSGDSWVFFYTLIISFIVAAILAVIHNRNDGRKVVFEPAEKIMVSGGFFLTGALLCLISAGMTDYSYYIFSLSETGLFICIGLIFALIYSAASSILVSGLTLASGKTGYVVHVQFLSLAAAGIFYYLCLTSENPALYGMNIVYIPALVLLSVLLIIVTRFRRPAAEEKQNLQNFKDNPESDENTLISGESMDYTCRRMPVFPEELYKNYTEISIAGAGGIAIVFRAKRLRDMREVAIKVPLNRDEITGRSFIREIGVWEKLRHKNIVKVYSVNILPVPYIEMEYIGRNLSYLPCPLPVESAIEIIEGILEGLMYAHKKGIVHHDIKPANVLIDNDGRPKLTDWGLCRTASDEYEYSNLGFSFVYAAPEQIFPGRFGKPDTRTDIYQAGLLFYEILTGRRPLAGDIIGEFLKKEALDIKPVSAVLCDDSLKELDRIIMHCLEKDPSKRYGDIESLLLDIKTAYRGIC